VKRHYPFKKQGLARDSKQVIIAIIAILVITIVANAVHEMHTMDIKMGPNGFFQLIGDIIDILQGILNRNGIKEIQKNIKLSYSIRGTRAGKKPALFHF